MCINDKTVTDREPAPPVSRSQIESVDIVKVKLKTARDRINNIINSKNRDIGIIDGKINEKIPAYQQTGNKKQIVPLLKAKKDLNTFVENAELRLRLVNDKLAEVQLQKINVDVTIFLIQTVNVLEDSNKYIKMAQQEMENRDWRNVLEQAKNKYELEWPEDDEEIENDPKFQALWNQLGGNKIPAKNQVRVQVPQGQQQRIYQSANRPMEQNRVITS